MAVESPPAVAALAPVPIAPSQSSPPAPIPLGPAASYAQAEKAAATRRAYAADWRHFSIWCESVIRPALPADPLTVAAYLSVLADQRRATSTIARRLAAIAYAHKLKGLASPAAAEPVRAVHRGIRRTLGTAPAQKAPATARAIESMLNALRARAAGQPARAQLMELRDRALLLLGFAAALRRSELVNLKVNDLEFGPDGLLVRIRRSKTDQEGKGHLVAVPRGARLRPVEAVEAWIDCLRCASGLDSDAPVFRSIGKSGRIGEKLTDRAVALIVKRAAAAAGLDAENFSGHSLRAGFVTSALEHRADLFRVMDVTRHRRVETLRGYDRRARAFRDHAGKDFL